MTVYEAIDEMRALSRMGVPFSFTFMSFSYDKNKSEGVVHVPHARLTKQSRVDQNQYADYMINYMDLDMMVTRHCWQPLIMEFNGEPVTLSQNEKKV